MPETVDATGSDSALEANGLPTDPAVPADVPLSEETEERIVELALDIAEDNDPKAPEETVRARALKILKNIRNALFVG